MENKIKVIHITQGFGGLFTYIKQVCSAIDYEKYEMYIIAPYNEECFEFCKINNINYTYVEMQRGFALISDLKSLFFLKKKIKQIRPHIVHVHSAKAGFLGRIASRWAKTKSIYTPHGLSYLGFTGLKRTAFFLLEVFCKRFTDEILACSESEKIRCLYELGISLEKIKVLPNAISSAKRNNSFSETDNKKDVIHIGVIARLTYQKNPLLFVEIAHKVHSEYPNTMFSILGAGLHDHLKPQTEDLINKFNLNDCFKILDWGSENSAEKYLKSLNIFLMTSIFEGLPFSLLEALSLGVLCVVSKCDGCNDVIDNAINGFSCLEVDDYVRIISDYIEGKLPLQYIKENGFDALDRKFNLEGFINRLEMIYEVD